MSRKTTSVKGEEVDFDILETKQNLESKKPQALEVKQRQDFVHKKRRSRGRSSAMEKIRQRNDNSTPKTSAKASASTGENKKESTATTPTKKKRRTIVKNTKEDQ